MVAGLTDPRGATDVMIGCFGAQTGVGEAVGQSLVWGYCAWHRDPHQTSSIGRYE
jgi:hypothetical protein